MNENIFEPVNNGPKHPFWESEFFVYKEKCRTLDLWSLCIPQTVFKILAGFMLRKLWLNVLLVLYSSKAVLVTCNLYWLLLLFPWIDMSCGEGMEGEACVYLCDSIEVASFCQS